MSLFENLISTENISFIIVFFEGILSFFSPCVIPLIPIYISYLAGSAKMENEDGTIVYERKKVFFHTLFFVLGISFAFFILGLSFTALGAFFNSQKFVISKLGGILIIILGLIQIGVFNFDFLNRERRLEMKLNPKKMNPIVAFVMGFTFSFAWTPCVGPALSSVLIMASGAKSSGLGNILVLVYSLGFVIPFLVLGLFTTQVLNFIKQKRNLLKYTIKIGGFLLILIGIMTFTGWMNGITGYLNSFGVIGNTTTTGEQEQTTNQEDSKEEEQPKEEETSKEQEETTNQNQTIPAFDFTLTDQYGNEHTLSDYKGKVVFLNFWATWCPPCQLEMPHIENIYNDYGLNKEDVIILGVANPKSNEYPHNQDVSEEEIKQFLDDKGYSFPVVFDRTGEVLYNYYISAFPTTFMIDKEGNIFGYVSSGLSKDMMINIIDQTLESHKK